MIVPPSLCGSKSWCAIALRQWFRSSRSRIIVGVSRVVQFHHPPETEPQAAEVRTEAARLGIAAVQSAIPGEFIPDQRPDRERRGDRTDEVIDAFRV